MVTAYHGSPFRFDKFSLDKYGTGDGKQIGGWGLYFNVLPELAQQYVLKGGALYEVEILRDGRTVNEVACLQLLNLDEPLEFDNGGAWIYARLKNILSTDDVEELEQLLGQSDYEAATGQSIYDWLSVVMDGQKEASLFLKDVGYVGNIFKDRGTSRTSAISDNEDRPNANYVIFDEESIRIKSIINL